MRAGYLPTMKEATSIWRRGDEGGAVMSDVGIEGQLWASYRQELAQWEMWARL